MELSEFLGPTTSAEPSETPEPAIETPVEAVEQPRNERGQFTKGEEPAIETPVEAAPAVEPEREPHTVPISVLQAERRRRQEAEARAASFEHPPQVEVQDDEFWEKPVEATRKVVHGATQEIRATVQAIRYDIAEDAARSLHADYDTVREAFITKVKSGDPAAETIRAQMNSQANPAKFMYDQVKRLENVEKVGDLPTYEARIRAEERAKVLIEMGKPPAPPQVPRSLNDVPSAATPDDGQSFTPTPLENLVTFNF